MKYKILMKLVIAILITIVIGMISTALMPILGNDIAIDQLKNDDAYFVAMQAWYSINNWLSLAAAAVWAWFAASIGVDIYKHQEKLIQICNSKLNNLKV